MRFLLIFSFMLISATSIIADIDKPMTINISENPVSLNGTYSIKRFVILKNKKIFIDSEDQNTITSSKGEVTIDLNITGNMINSTLKMQMEGNIFKEGSAFYDYDFIYTKRVIPLINNEDNTSLEDKLSNIGLHYYKSENKIIWEIPFEEDKIIIMILDKNSNRIKNLSKSKYLFL